MATFVAHTLEQVEIIHPEGSVATQAGHKHFTFRHSPVERPTKAHSLIVNINDIPNFNSQPSSITQLNLGTRFISVQNFLHVMHATSTSLTRASLYIVYDIPPTTLDHGHVSSIKMVALTSLSLRLVNTSLNPAYILPIEMSALKDFTAEWADSYTPFEWDIKMFTRLLKSASNSLRSFRLSDLPSYPAPGRWQHRMAHKVSPDDLNELLRTVPNLETLALPTSISIPISILTSISHGALLPHLNDFGLATKNDLKSILSHVRFRNQDYTTAGVSPITALRLTIPLTSHAARADVHSQVDSLALRKGYSLLFLGTCFVCSSHCYFGN
ncbi:hypothetical protein CVT26_009231 [Gymnopilus dilepis]|uniref:Uncharacterized protein n=1 Tax=Gymnopilus dilepis TaxID=231916 RepID=A0A409YRP8_9AGAR|nr:hypothetical protein CVT26_009231 [Gymnopilus dilepis]